MLAQPFVGEFYQRFLDALMGDQVEGFADEGGDEQRLGFGGRDAARHQIEEMVMVQVARGGAMAADHVIGEDFKLGLGIEFGGFRQQERVAGLLAIGFLRVLPDDDLALENSPGVDHPSRI